MQCTTHGDVCMARLVFPDEFSTEMSVGADRAFAYSVNPYYFSVV